MSQGSALPTCSRRGPARREEDVTAPCVSSWISTKAAKGIPSDIEGRGLRAVAPIAAGEVVGVKGGHVVTTAELGQLSDRLRNSEIQIADDLHLVALDEEEYEPVMLFVNHSCEPNVGVAGNVVLVACAMWTPARNSPSTTRCSTTTTNVCPVAVGPTRAGVSSPEVTGAGPSCRTATAATSRGTWPGGWWTTDPEVPMPSSSMKRPN